MQATNNDPSADNCSAPGRIPDAIDDNEHCILENWDDDENIGGSRNTGPNSDGSDHEDFLQEISQKDKKVELLVGMGFAEAIAQMAVIKCGHAASMCVLVDWLHASETAGDGCYRNVYDDEDNSYEARKKTRFMEQNKKKRKRYGGPVCNIESLNGSDDDQMPIPNPMTGFSLPDESLRSVNRCLQLQAIGPPFFYFENVALAPKGVWTTISRFLHDIKPEFVDSKFFCACARKRGYIHNLPIENRKPLIPLPPKTISEAFPNTRKWWPSWDPRQKFNCLQTCLASAKLTVRIRCALANSHIPPSLRDQKYVLEECRRWNLVWVGKNKIAPLEPHEMEFLLGFPKDHTRGISRTERCRSLGNSFQIDTVAYHLSALKDIFPNGMNVLSLFSGIGGAEVALHRLGIHMKTVVSVEKSKVSRAVLRSWWEETQTGTLIEVADIENLTSAKIEYYIRTIGGFDLVIGGSPCNNFTGSNRHHRSGLDGAHSSLFLPLC